MLRAALGGSAVSKGVQAVGELIGAAVAAYFGDYKDAAALAAAAFSTWQAGQKEKQAKNAYNQSLRDRYAMVRSSTAARQLVFGRCRVSGPVFFAKSYGPDDSKLVLCIALAAHEIDAVETVYFDDKPISIDGSGNVTGVQIHEAFSIASTGATVTIQKTPTAGSVTATARYGDNVVTLGVSVTGTSVTVTGALSGQTGQLDVYYKPNPDPYAPSGYTQRSTAFTVTSSSQAFTLPSVDSAGKPIAAPNPSDVHGIYRITSQYADDALTVSTFSVSGYTVTATGLTVGRTIVFYYQTANAITKARVRAYLGAPGQTADATMITNLPGTWTSNHKASGVAYLVVELDYDQDAFIGGVPNVSAVIRGMKCFDPRTSTTAWTENPALHARALAAHSLGGNLPAAMIDDASVITAANACDVSATYVVGSATHVRPIYKSSYSHTVDKKPIDGIEDLCQAMGGSWVWSDGQLRLFAGTYVTPNPLTLDETWLSDDMAPSIQAAAARQDLMNTVTASFPDQFQDYTVVPMPKIAPSTYIAADGAILAQNIEYPAVTFSGQAQYLASCMMRRQRLGLTVKLRCNYRAWQIQARDVQLVTLSRFGWVNKPFEVLEDSQTADGSIELTLQATDPSVWNMDAAFTALPINPNTLMPQPWGIPQLTNLVANSGDSTLIRQADGTVVPQIQVTWDAITDSRVLQGGYVEIRYWRMGDSADTYSTIKALGTDTQAFLPGVRVGSQYVIVARAASVVTQSLWTAQIFATASGKSNPPANVTSLTATEVYGAIILTWDQPTNFDYQRTELRQGASWAAGVPLLGSLPTYVRGVHYSWAWPAQGSYTVWAVHYDRSGNASATPASVAVTVDAGINIHDGQVQTATAVSITKAKHTPDGETFRDNIVSITYTPTQNCTAVLAVSGTASYTTGAANPFAQIRGGIYIAGSFSSGVDCFLRYINAGNAQADFTGVYGSQSFALTGGTSYTFKFLVCKWDTTDTATINNIEMRLDVIKGV
jgi:hypothetical protein